MSVFLLRVVQRYSIQPEGWAFEVVLAFVARRLKSVFALPVSGSYLVL
ncbi:hypothetical protein TRICHSKD4_2980 [Roseibium sp. TrichSKD4]|nr:hypothetical protein TRICHSKD4_2980 [Roseibium sp. TrichSKD4]